MGSEMEMKRRYIVKKNVRCGCWTVIDRQDARLPMHFDHRIRARKAANWLNQHPDTKTKWGRKGALSKAIR